MFSNKDEFIIIDDGRTAAFPGPGENPECLRDWFAGQALVGLLANPGAFNEYASKGHEVFKDYPRSAYDFADAMLAARGDK